MNRKNKLLKQLVLDKSGQKFIFRYEAGCEESILNALIDQAKDSRTDFDWFDAAVLSFKLINALMMQADDILHQNNSGTEIGAG